MDQTEKENSSRKPELNGAAASSAAQPPVSSSFDLLQALAWLEANKKRVITWTAAVVGVGLVVALFLYNENQKEVRASKALSEVALPLDFRKTLAPDAIERLLKLERDYPNTKAAARALVQAAGARFAQGQYDEAQKLFGRFEKDYPESVWLPQALLGYASTFEVQGKTAEALTEFEKLRKRFPNDAIADEVKLALGRLYEQQNKPEEALTLYQDILKMNPPGYSSLGAEAGTRQEALLQKFPNLIKTNVPPTNVVSFSSSSLTNRPAATNRAQTISLTNLVKRTNAPATTLQATNRPGTNAPLLIKPTTQTSAPPAAAK